MTDVAIAGLAAIDWRSESDRGRLTEADGHT
jgi:hypothetical protein